MRAAEWQQTNLKGIEARLAPLRALPDGPIFDERGLQHIRVIKQGDQLQLFFVNSDGALEGPMSRIDLRRPLQLLSSYTQAAMLALLWRPTPRRACLLGFAGGRMALVLHHHLPDLTIDNVEIDPAFRELAPRFFGVGFDARQRLAIADARAFLAEHAGPPYEIMVMDAFRDDADQLDRLATAEFYALCRRRLARGGVLCVNLLRSDPRFAAKIRALQRQFGTIYLAELKHSLVLFATDQPRTPHQRLALRAAKLQARHQFHFPFAERAAGLAPLAEASPHLLEQIRRAEPLSDAQVQGISGSVSIPPQ